MSKTNIETLSTSALRQLRRFGDRVNRLGANLVVCDGAGQIYLVCERQGSSVNKNAVSEFARRFLKSSRKEQGKGTSGAVGGVSGRGRFVGSVLQLRQPGAQAFADSFAVLVDLGQTGDTTGYKSAVFGEMLGLFAEKLREEHKSAEQIDMISTELAQTYEELVLLYKISTNMELVEPDANFLQTACDNLTDIVSVEGIAVLQEKVIEDEKRFVLVAGSGLIDIGSEMTIALYNRLVEVMGTGREALLDSEVDSPFRYDWPKQIRNIIAVPLCGKDKTRTDTTAGRRRRDDSKAGSGTGEGKLIGMMVAINRLDKQDFDSTDVKLFSSVASECAVFVENNRLFSELKELFIGSLKALTRSIDAKDRYTRGHSERVAFISKWLAEHVAEKEGLDEVQIQRVYLAGLLHDIGKVGIDESVLCKKGKLSEQERSRLRMHPSIGANILSGIKQMREIIPGVLYHHERVDGTGYPDGLSGEQIPLMGRIVGLADCFDAMTSERVYRQAMSIEDALGEIERRLGSQFDEKLGRVFIESDVHHLWDIMQDGLVRAYGAEDFSDYGTAAVGALIA